MLKICVCLPKFVYELSPACDSLRPSAVHNSIITYRFSLGSFANTDWHIPSLVKIDQELLAL